ncbi:MAG: hypothetical protein A2Y42_01095 [Omnitrophica WOR_2 bacterium GWB2_45_9]|nr:MAG: hypothetical protein A2Y42_01095 [Omnitrophica WOR_2 bacterium GWB2_45_9]OGX60737.1 MAG: hypothetical protein A2471_00310 [Omnitrophica WOR_2 bacterium RIFOXYC2_FULL_45_15]
MKKDVSTHRVVTFLTREELEFLDKLEKDMMFSTGRHLSRSQILQDMAELLSKTRMNAIGIKSDDELKKKIQEAISRMNQQDKEKNPQDKSEV